MYTIFDKKNENEYDGGFIEAIESFGRIQYEKEDVMKILTPSFNSLSEKEQIKEDLFTPGNILYRHYEHGRLHIDYIEKYKVATDRRYRAEKLTDEKVKDFYGL